MKAYWLSDEQAEELEFQNKKLVEYMSTREVTANFGVTDEFLLENIELGNISSVQKGLVHFVYLDGKTKEFLSSIPKEVKSFKGNLGNVPSI